MTVGSLVGELVSRHWSLTCRRALVTVTSTVPVPAGEVAVIEVERVDGDRRGGVAAERRRSRSAVKPVPVMVTDGAAGRGPGVRADGGDGREPRR